MSAAISDFRDKITREKSRVVSRVMKDLTGATHRYTALVAQVAATRADFDTATSRLELLQSGEHDLQQRIAELQDTDAAALQIPLASKLSRLQSLHRELKTIQCDIATQTDATTRLDRTLNKLEHELVDAEVGLSRLRDAASSNAPSRLADVSREAEVAVLRRRGEERRGAERSIRKSAAATQRTLTSSRWQQEFDDKLEAALAEDVKAKHMSKEATERAKEVADAMLQIEEVERAARADSLLQLKTSLDESRAAIAARHQYQQAVAEAKAKAFNARTAAIEATGKNPREVYLLEQRQQQLDLAAKQHAEKIASAEMALTHRLIHEDEKAIVFEQATEEAQAVEREFRDRMSRPVRDAATHRYIAGRTVHGDALLDPSGKAAYIAPSAATRVLPAHFGLGKMDTTRPDILGTMKMKAEKMGVSTIKSLLPRRTASPKKQNTIDDDMADMGGTSLLDDEIEADTAERDEGAAESKSPKTKFRAKADLSVYEKQMMADALERQKGGIISEQVVTGRHFRGPGFSCTPAVIHFKDFTVDQPQTVHLTITNISLSFNSFRLEPLPDEYRDMFTLALTPPGRMSAGMSVPLTITFHPRTNKDIECDLVIFAQTGKIPIPLRCTTRKAVPEFDALSVDVGRVVLGESMTATARLRNEGAIPLTARLQCEGDLPSLTVPSMISVDGYSSVRIPIRFTPSEVGPIHARIRCEFDPLCDPAILEVSAVGDAVPLYVEQETIDFRTCVVNKVSENASVTCAMPSTTVHYQTKVVQIYRATVIVRNRGNVALKCGIHADPLLLKHNAVVVAPSNGFVMAKDASSGVDGAFAFSIQLVLTPALCDAHGVDEEGRMVFKMRLIAPEQTLPVDFVISCKPSPADLGISPRSLDFGINSTGQAVQRIITVQNTTLLPQQVSLRCSRSEFQLARDFASVHVILPRETLEVPILFCPTAAVRYDAQLEIATTMNAVYNVPLSGKGNPAVLTLSHTNLAFGAAPKGHVEEASILITNSRDEPVVFEVTPSRSQSSFVGSESLTVLPKVGRLDGKGSMRLLVRFTASVPDDCVLPFTNEWTVPIVAKSAGQLESSCSFSVCTTVTKPTLVVESTVVPFGEMPCGKEKVVPIWICNDGEIPLRILAILGDASSAFTLVSVPRVLAPSTRDSVMVSFKPLARMKYAQMLIIKAENAVSVRHVALHGEGVSPVLRFLPGESTDINFGTILLGEKVTKTLTLENGSAFPVQFSVLEKHADPQLAAVDVPVSAFNVEPVGKILAPAETLALTISYTPLVVHNDLHNAFTLVVPGQDAATDLSFRVAGKCVDRSFTVTPSTANVIPVNEYGFSPLMSASDAAALKAMYGTINELPVAFMDTYDIVFPKAEPPKLAAEEPKEKDKSKAAAPKTPVDDKLSEGLLLTPLDVDKSADSKAAPAANAKTKTTGTGASSKGGSAAAVSYQATLTPVKGDEEAMNYFSVEPSSSTTSAPQQISFRFNPYKNSASSAKLPDGIIMPGRWVQCEGKVVFTGGVLAKGAPAAKVVLVRLKGYVPFTI